MLFNLLLGFLVLLLIFMFMGARLSVSLEGSPYQSIFWVLFGITFITVLEIIFCFFLYFKFRNKDGKEGPRGYEGHPGDKGDDGKCNQNSCKTDTIKLMVIKIFEKKLGRILSNEERNLVLTGLSGILEIKLGDVPIPINDVTLDEVKQLHAILTRDIELDYFKIDHLKNSQTKIFDYFTEPKSAA